MVRDSLVSWQRPTPLPLLVFWLVPCLYLLILLQLLQAPPSTCSLAHLLTYIECDYCSQVLLRFVQHQIHFILWCPTTSDNLGQHQITARETQHERSVKY